MNTVGPEIIIQVIVFLVAFNLGRRFFRRFIAPLIFRSK